MLRTEWKIYEISLRQLYTYMYFGHMRGSDTIEFQTQPACLFDCSRTPFNKSELVDDVMVFPHRSPTDPSCVLIKRVVALEGDAME